MASGNFDINGVWQYGEDDDEFLFSDLLNLGMASISGAIGDITDRLDNLETDLVGTITPGANCQILAGTTCRRDGQKNTTIVLGSLRSAAIADGTTVATIPLGFRPAQNTICPGATSNGGAAQACFVQILPNGAVTIYAAGTGNKQANVNISYVSV